jgi:hypothetical protein
MSPAAILSARVLVDLDDGRLTFRVAASEEAEALVDQGVRSCAGGGRFGRGGRSATMTR